MLMGHSWDGWFALYTLFHQTHLFQQHVISRPNMTFDDEQKYAERHDSLPARVHLSFGERELD